MSHLINKIPYPLNLGKQLENGVTTHEFDISAWTAAYPTIACAITAECADVSAPFLVTGVSQDGNTLTWLVGNDVTQYDGKYTIVIRGLVDDTEKRSAVINAFVTAGHGEAGDAPTDVTDWMSEAAALKAEVEAAEDAHDEAYAGAETARDDLYTNAETARDNLYTAAEGARDNLYEAAEESRDTAEGLRVAAEDIRAGFYAGFDAQLAENANAIDANYLWRETTANPAQVYPVPGSPLHVVASGQYTQAGSGDPSPDNIRAITPWVSENDEIAVHKMGANFANPAMTPNACTLANGVYTSSALNAYNGWTIGVNSSGALANASKSIPLTNVVMSFQMRRLSGAGSLNYIAIGYGETQNGTRTGYLRHNDAAATIISKPAISTAFQTYAVRFAMPSDANYLCFMGQMAGDAVSAVVELKELQFEFSDASQSDYIEFDDGSSDITLTAPADIYSGWLNNDGEGEDEWKEVNPLTVSNITDLGTVLRCMATVSNDYIIYLGLSSHFVSMTSYSVDSEHFYYAGNGTLWMYINKSRLSSNDAAGVNAWLSAQSAASTPVQFLLKYTTPTALTPAAASLVALTQADRITPKLNVITCDTGDLATQYAKSPIQESDEIAAAILALTP